MNLRHLEFAVAAATERSFSRAAERCHVTQPTLSNGIALLEETFGGQLFVRTTRKVELSAFGEQMLPLIQAVLRAQSELEAGMRSFYDPSTKVVRVGLVPLVDARRVTAILDAWSEEHPGARTFFKECLLGDLEERLAQGQLDVAVRPVLPDEPAPRSLVRTPFYDEDLYFLPRHSGLPTSAADTGDVTLKQMAGETLVLCPEGCGLAATTRRLFKEAGVVLKEYRGQPLSYHGMQEWAELGIGATLVPASKIVPGFRARARRMLVTAKRPARIRFELLWMRDTAYPRHVAQLHRYFVERVARREETVS
ncbi:MAG TPA: LysR family transcriptional regulator [Nevskiaceae bacterium]|nr:LysR family transcriptional regulator [Nevskiaceae bacterium]